METVKIWFKFSSKVEDLNPDERKDAELIGNGKFAVDNPSRR